MIYLVSILGVLAVISASLGVIFVMLRDHAEAIVAALAGRSVRAEALLTPSPRVRITLRTPVRRSVLVQPLRAAA